MRLFITVHIDDGPRPDAAMRQRVSAALALIGLHNTLDGHKGPVHLPRNMFACTLEVEALGRNILQDQRSVTSDALSQVLDDIAFKGQFFVTVSAQACWGYRPVPRHNKAGKQSDLDKLNLTSSEWVLEL